MFPQRFFPGRYFAARYWPKTGATGVLISDFIVGTTSSLIPAYTTESQMPYLVTDSEMPRLTTAPLM